ncbi:hypothetical protein UACE39S_06279 [Ureibacillus acetophenoni]
MTFGGVSTWLLIVAIVFAIVFIVISEWNSRS